MRQRDVLQGAIYRAVIGCNTYQGREADGENLNFAGMVEAVGGMVGVVRVLVVVWVRVSVFRGCKVASCRVARLQV